MHCNDLYLQRIIYRKWKKRDSLNLCQTHLKLKCFKVMCSACLQLFPWQLVQMEVCINPYYYFLGWKCLSLAPVPGAALIPKVSSDCQTVWLAALSAAWSETRTYGLIWLHASYWRERKLYNLSKEIRFLGTPNKTYSQGVYLWVALGEVAATDELPNN